MAPPVCIQGLHEYIYLLRVATGLSFQQGFSLPVQIDSVVARRQDFFLNRFLKFVCVLRPFSFICALLAWSVGVKTKILESIIDYHLMQTTKNIEGINILLCKRLDCVVDPEPCLKRFAMLEIVTRI